MILAGGEGTRLRPLTEMIVADGRPKQFCALLGDETLLEQTWRRAESVIEPGRTVTVLTQPHARFFAPLVARTPGRCLVIQPENRGTAPAILYGLSRIAARAPMGPVAILPSDHYVSDDAVFMSHVEAAFDAVDVRPDLVVLLGIAPEGPETDYGWIEPGDAIPGGRLRRVRRFWEKPASGTARLLLDRGCLWNSFVVVARIPAIWSLIRAAAPELDTAFVSVRATFGTAAEGRAVARLYAGLPAINFSDRVLATHPANLAVLPVTGVTWSDWGQPRRVLATLARLGVEPEWAKRTARMVASA